MKICPGCKNEFEDSVKFCPDCGIALEDAESGNQKGEENITAEKINISETKNIEEPENIATELSSDVVSTPPIPETIHEPEPKKNGKAKKILIPAAIAVSAIAIIICACIAVFSSGNRFDVTKNSIWVGKDVDGDAVIVFNGKYTVNIDGSMTSRYMNKNNTKLYAVIDDKLVAVSKNETVDIDTDVSSFEYSAKSDTIVYMKNADDETGDLYTWKSGKPTRIDTDVYYEMYFISPSAKAVSYIKNYNGSDEFETYISKNGKPGDRLDKDNCMVFMLSDNANLMFYMNDKDEKVYSSKGKTDTEICGIDEIESFKATSDLKEVLLVSDSKLYMVRNGAERQKIKGDVDYIYISRPDNAVNCETVAANGITYVDTKSFTGTILVSYDSGYDTTLFSFDKKLNITEYEDKADSYKVTDDGDWIFYIKDGNLYRMKFAKKDSEEPIAKDAVSFDVSFDGKKVYYINNDDELCMINGIQKTIIAEDVSDLKMNSAGYVYYISGSDGDSGTLYCVKNGGKSEKVANGDEVSSIIPTGGTVMFLGNYDDNEAVLYAAKGKKSTKLVAEISY